MKGDARVGPRWCSRVIWKGRDGVHRWSFGDQGEDGACWYVRRDKGGFTGVCGLTE